MRSRSLLSFLLISASLPILAATTQNKPLSMNDWHVAPMVSNGSASPSYCAMATHYASGPVVTFTRNAHGKGSIAIDFANADLQKGKRYAVSLYTSGHSQRFAATAISNTQLVLQTGLNKILNDSLAAGNELTVTLDGTAGTYTLAGNTRAFFEFEHCLKALAPTDSNFAVASNTSVPAQITSETQQVAAINNPPVLITPVAPPVSAAPAPVATLASASMPFNFSEPLPEFQPIPESVIATAQIAPTPVNYVPTSAPIVSEDIVITQPTAKISAPPLQSAALSEEPYTSILWDEGKPAVSQDDDSTSFAPATLATEQPKAKEEAASPLPIAEKISPTKERTFEKTSEPKAERVPAKKLAKTIPAAGEAKESIKAVEINSQDDTKKRLKSSLAQARAEAAGEESKYIASALEAPQPVAAPMALTASTTEETSEFQKPVVVTPISDMSKADINAEETTSTPTAQRVPLVSMHTPSKESEMHDLLFDNTQVLPGNGSKPYSAPKAETKPSSVTPAPVIKSEPVKQEIIKPAPKAAAKEPERQIEKETPRFEANESPASQEVIPSLPPTMPPAAAPTLAVEKETPTIVASAPAIMPDVPSAPVNKAPSTLNTVTPSVGHPIKTPFTNRTQIESVAAKRRIVTFIPAPASQTNQWTTRQIGGIPTNDLSGFCLIENSFDNDTKLMISQRADGYSTLGLNYGIDMLREGRNYRVNVKVDDLFDEDFTGYAENSHTLVVQMGKKASFFDSLTRANAINVAMPGVASTFGLQNLVDELDDFSACLVGLGGQPITQQTALLSSVIAPNSPLTISNDPVQTASLETPSAQTAPIMPTPIAEEQPTAQTGEVQKLEVTDKTYHPVIPAFIHQPELKQTVSHDVLWDKPAATVVKKPRETIFAAKSEKIDIMPEMKTEPVQQAEENTWSRKIRHFLTQSGVPGSVNVSENTATWSDGSIKGVATAITQTDVLDAADAVLTKAEKACDGEFSSQMGLPETYGSTTAQAMESKCVNTDGSVSVSTWLVQQQNDGQITSVQMETPKNNRTRAFNLRDKMLSILKKSGNTASTDNHTNQNKSS